MTEIDKKPDNSNPKRESRLEKNKPGRPKKDRDDPFRAGLRGDLVPVNFQWARETVMEMDKAAGELGMPRSQLIRRILTEWLVLYEIGHQ